MKKWEYKSVKFDEPWEQWENKLNTLGKDGWELIQWVRWLLVFKREIQE